LYSNTLKITFSKYFNKNFNGRIGLNFSKKLKNKSLCNLYLQYIKGIHYVDRIYFETHELNLLGNGYMSSHKRNIIDLSQNGIQLGVYITFAKNKKANE
jgi:hypothetical protein